LVTLNSGLPSLRSGDDPRSRPRPKPFGGMDLEDLAASMLTYPSYSVVRVLSLSAARTVATAGTRGPGESWWS